MYCLHEIPTDPLCQMIWTVKMLTKPSIAMSWLILEGFQYISNKEFWTYPSAPMGSNPATDSELVL